MNSYGFYSRFAVSVFCYFYRFTISVLYTSCALRFPDFHRRFAISVFAAFAGIGGGGLNVPALMSAAPLFLLFATRVIVFLNDLQRFRKIALFIPDP